MTGTRDNEDRPTTAPTTKSVSVADKTKGKTVEQIDGDLGRTWVRMMLGRNRGEDRSDYRAFDSLLDERLKAQA